MRIAVDANPAARALRTGTETYTIEILKALAHRDASSEYLLFANQPRPPPDLRLPANFAWNYLAPRRAWSHRALGPAATRARPDLLFIPAHVLPATYHGRSVVTVHDVGHRHVRRAYRWTAWLYLEASTRWAARFATRLIAVSESTGRDLIQLYGVPARRVTVVPEGVPEDATAVPPVAIQRVAVRYALGHPYFLFIGSLHPRKNLEFLARAFDRAFAAGPGTLLALAGQPVAGAERLDRVAGIRRLGYVPRADLLPLLAGARALVLPSHFEGFGLPGIEAMACGTPVLASRAGALPDTIGDAGVLLAADDLEGWIDALRSLRGDDGLRARLSDRGRRRAARFNWDHAAQALLEVFAQVS